MQTAFDPYHEWLGIGAGQRPPDHYTLLGLSPLESDPATISYAADMQAAKIRRIRPGQHAADWGKLLDQVSVAKTCLLDPASKQAYDDALPAAQGEMTVVVTLPAGKPSIAVPPPLASHNAPPSDSERPRAPFPVGYGQKPTMAASGGAMALPPSMAPVPAQGVVVPPPFPPKPARDAWSNPLESQPKPVDAMLPLPPWPGGSVGVPTSVAIEAEVAQPAQRSPKSSTLIIAALLLLIVLLGGGLAYVLRNPRTQVAASSPEGAGMDTAAMQSKADQAVPYKRPDNSRKPNGNRPEDKSPAANDSDANPAQSESANPNPANSDPALIPDASKPETENPPPDNLPQDNPPSIDKPPVDKPADQPPAEPNRHEDPAKHQAFKKAVAEARLAMGQRDMARARKAVKDALANVQNQAEDDEAARTDALEQNLSEFWKSIADAISTFQPGTEVPYKDTRFMVVEASRTSLTIKAGKMHRYKIDEIPTPLLTAISTDLIVQDAGWKMLLGTFLAMDADGNRDVAKTLWQAAAREGAPIDQLLPELNISPVGKRKKTASDKDAKDAAGSSDSIEVLQWQIAAIQQRAKVAKGMQENAAVAKDALQRFEAAASARHWEEAGQLLDIARSTAHKSENIALTRQAANAAGKLQAMKNQ